jgi:uncharacterized membrane protein YphA (DoxX/SURF4 family)
VIRSTFDRLLHEPLHRSGQRALQLALGAMICFRVITEWPAISYLFGPHSIASIEPSVSSYLAAKAFSTDFRAHATLAIEAGLASCLALGFATRWATIALLLVVKIVFARQPWILDGGDNVVGVVLPYMCFLLPARTKNWHAGIRVWLHNLGVIAIIAQTCIIYWTAGFYKIQGSMWTGGTALYAISQVDLFSTPLSSAMFKNPWIVTICTYATMIHQIWFPIAIFTRLRPLWIAVGTMFHISIAILMGLLPFSIIMMGMEWVTLRDAEFAYLGRSLSRSRQFITRAIRLRPSLARAGQR